MIGTTKHPPDVVRAVTAEWLGGMSMKAIEDQRRISRSTIAVWMRSPTLHDPETWERVQSALRAIIPGKPRGRSARAQEWVTEKRWILMVGIGIDQFTTDTRQQVIEVDPGAATVPCGYRMRMHFDALTRIGAADWASLPKADPSRRPVASAKRQPVERGIPPRTCLLCRGRFTPPSRYIFRCSTCRSHS